MIMSKDEFLIALSEELEIDNQELTDETYWEEIEDFSSMSILIIIALVDEKFNQRIRAEQFTAMKQVKDLLHIIDLK
jgi:acyl carrier protein